MTKQEFLEYYKNNKTVVIGVPIIVFILLLDLLVLKPARLKKQEERNAANRGVAAQPAAATSAAPVSASSSGAPKSPIQMPEPLRPPSYPALSEKVETRFQLTKVFPYSPNERNIFTRGEKKIEIIPQIMDDEEQTIDNYERPDISYHGFFSIGSDRIAILKSSDELMLTRIGNMLKSSPFRLGSVFPDRVVIIDTSETSREFEVALSEKPSEGGNKP